MIGGLESSGRILGLDPGERRIGVAISDPLGVIAQPHSVIQRPDQDVLKVICDLVTEHEISVIVIGFPVSLSGHEGPSANAARAFATGVANAVDCEVELMDERFSTAAAERLLREGNVPQEERRAVKDKIAAAVILQGYLDRRPAVP